MKSVYAKVIALMEYKGELVEASQFLLDRLVPNEKVYGLEVIRHNVTQWTDPNTNEKIINNGRYKYTVETAMNFVFDGNYSQCQQWLVDCLMKNEELSYMTIQMIDLTMADYVIPPKNDDE